MNFSQKEVISRVENPVEGDLMAAIINTEREEVSSQKISPRYVHISTDDNNYCAYHWSRARTLLHCTHEEFTEAGKVLASYKAAKQAEEDDELWQPEGEPRYYADNSVEQLEVNRHGKTRWVHLAPPSGDLCF